ncbi:LuxR C-terminal-related transcriptional regulator [Streptomyces sp. NPDC002573]|uniref:LuxR C-terminal-related transcriptional regulator n=1 Tax=Streptomyces sp. NPDC002573 TaxID=3364651 RepID=UPI0036D0211E
MTDLQTRRQLEVLVVDDSLVIRRGLGNLVGTEPLLSVAGEAEDATTALLLAKRVRPHVVLFGNQMPLAVLPELTSISRVVVLSFTADPATITAAMLLGASGFLIHGDFTSEELLRAVRAVGPDSTHLSPLAAACMLRPLRESDSARTLAASHLTVLSRREQEVMVLISKGLSNSQIATMLFLSEKTVKNHINHIFGKLQVHNRAEAMAQWLGTAQPGGAKDCQDRPSSCL